MNAAPLDSPPPAELPHSDEAAWSTGRWIIYITLAFGLHVGLLYGLSDHKPLPPRAVKNAATLLITSGQTEPQQLDDPTLFARPHPRGFAAATWLRLPQITFAPFRWTEPPRLLPLAAEQLGAIFLRHAETNAPAPRQIETAAAPMTAVLAPVENAITRDPATVRVNGALSGRALRTAPDRLPLQPPLDSLTNTVVQVLVDARGQVISATLTPASSGSKEADQEALRLARNVRFTAINDATKLTVGKLIFEWQALPATNSAAKTP